MDKVIKFGFFVVSIVLTFVGLVILHFSVSEGMDQANNYLRNEMYGSMDTDQFLIVAEGFVLRNVVTGGIFLFVGLICISFYIHTINKEYRANK